MTCCVTQRKHIWAFRNLNCKSTNDRQQFLKGVQRRSILSVGQGRPEGQQRGVFPPHLPSRHKHCPLKGWATARSCPESLLGLQNGKLASQGSHLFCKSWERLNRFGANDLGHQRHHEDALGRSEMGFKTQVLWRRPVELSSASLVVPSWHAEVTGKSNMRFSRSVLRVAFDLLASDLNVQLSINWGQDCSEVQSRARIVHLPDCLQ